MGDADDDLVPWLRLTQEIGEQLSNQRSLKVCQWLLRARRSKTKQLRARFLRTRLQIALLVVLAIAVLHLTRIDGRTFSETRGYQISHGILQSVDGSALCHRRSNDTTDDDTVVLAAVTIQVGQTTLQPVGDVRVELMETANHGRFQSLLQDIAEASVDVADLALQDGFAMRLDIRLTVLLGTTAGGGYDVATLDVCVAALSAALHDTTIPSLEHVEGTFYRLPHPTTERRLKLTAVPCAVSAVRTGTFWLVDPTKQEQSNATVATVVVNAASGNVLALELLPGVAAGVSTTDLESIMVMARHHATRMLPILQRLED